MKPEERREIAVKIMRSKGLEPLEEYTTAKAMWKCRCLVCGRITKPRFWNVRNSKSTKKGCAFCVGVRVDAAEAKAIMLNAGLKAIAKYPGKDAPWESKCVTCGDIVFPTWNNIRKGQGGCGRCRYIKSANSNRTPQKDAIARMLKSGLLPLESYLNKDMPWKSKCLKCNNITYPTLGNIRKGQGGCAFCRETGINYFESAYLYVMYSEEFHSIKIGVSNIESKPNRIKSHQKYGWKLIDRIDFDSGQEAVALETKTLRWLRKTKNFPAHLKASDMPQGGHSETVNANLISFEQISKFIHTQ